MYSSNLYRSSPVWLQEILIAARGYSRARLREGRQFERFAAEAEASQWLGPEELRALQRRQVESIVGLATSTVPFYRELYRDARHDGAWADTLHRLPPIDKPTVRAAGRSLLSEAAPHPLFEGSTSGTTGAPLKLFQDLAAVSRENAFIRRQLRWAGYVPGAPRAWIRGDMAVPVSQSQPPYWRHNSAERMLILSSYHLSAATADAYLAALATYAPVVIQAYPSSIGFLAAYLRAAGRFYEGASLRAIVTSSETVTSDSRALVEERFGCRLFDWYGQFERVAAIGTCERGSLHVIEDYGLVEFEPAADGLHEIVGTGFNNRAMPLIRYRTGDLVELAPTGENCDCGRHFRVVRRVLGRDDDVLQAARRSPHRARGRHVRRPRGMLDAQIRQDSAHEVCIRVVPAPNWSGPTRSAARAQRARAARRLGRDQGRDGRQHRARPQRQVPPHRLQRVTIVPAKLRWAANRLSRMSPAEVGFRVLRAVRVRAEQAGWGLARRPPPPACGAATSWLPSERGAVDAAPIVDAAERILAGRFQRVRTRPPVARLSAAMERRSGDRHPRAARLRQAARLPRRRARRQHQDAVGAEPAPRAGDAGAGACADRRHALRRRLPHAGRVVDRAVPVSARRALEQLARAGDPAAQLVGGVGSARRLRRRRCSTAPTASAFATHGWPASTSIATSSTATCRATRRPTTICSANGWGCSSRR